MTEHEDWTYEIKLSNDNTKGETRVTVKVRSDSDPEAAKKLAVKLFTEKIKDEAFAT